MANVFLVGMSCCVLNEEMAGGGVVENSLQITGRHAVWVLGMEE